MSEHNAWRDALQKLTPLGSEFTDPNACYEYVRIKLDGAHKVRMDLVQARRDVERERDDALTNVAALKELSTRTNEIVVRLEDERDAARTDLATLAREYAAVREEQDYLYALYEAACEGLGLDPSPELIGNEMVPARIKGEGYELRMALERTEQERATLVADNARLSAEKAQAEQRAANARDLCLREVDHARAAEAEAVRLKTIAIEMSSFTAHTAACDRQWQNNGGQCICGVDALVAAARAALATGEPR